ncbi:MAG TPA: xanthine dehydrogenase family protein subunit M [Amycolatopsis sp.]|nr:xanthine dehydrogenase family protein subunit M [Amycolatopsis sp.]
MKPAPFDYVRAGSVDEAVRTLAEAGGEGKVLAGGQSLMPVLALRMARPRVLVDVNRIPGLATITPVDGGVRLGALVRHARLATQQNHPLLAEAARWIGHTAIRTRGTTGGSIAHADPSAELPVVAAALGATVHIAGPGGQRSEVATDFFAGPLETTLAEDELVTAVEFPAAERWGFAEFSRRHGDFGLVLVAAAQVDGRWRLAIGGVGGVPVRPTEAEQLLNDGAGIDAVAAAAAAEVRPQDDIHASGDYRRAMTAEFVRRALAPHGKRAAA